MKCRIFIFILALLGVSAFGDEEGVGVKVCVQEDWVLSAEFLEEPILIADNKIVAGREVPDWYAPFIADRRSVEMEYEEYIGYFANECLVEMGLTEEAFKSQKKIRVLQDMWLEKASVISLFRVENGGRKFLFVNYYRGEWLNSYKEGVDLEFGISTSILEWQDNRWKMQHPLLFKWMIGVSSLGRLEIGKILKEKRMLVKNGGMTIVPHD